MQMSPVVAACLLALALPAAAQTTGNPLQPRPGAGAPSTPARAATPVETAATPAKDAAAKPKRPRSEAQLRNDNRLRACGAEWRANKPKLTAEGYNWIKYSGECRKRLAAQGQ